MKIAFIMHNYLPEIGGAQISVHCMANSLSKSGHNIIVYSDSKLVKACIKNGWRFTYKLKGLKLPLNNNFIRDFAIKLYPALWRRLMFKSIRPIIEKDRPEIIQIVHAWPWLPVTKEIKETFDIPVLIRCVGDDIQVDDFIGYGIQRDRRKKNLLQKGFAAADTAVAISKTVMEEYIKAGIPPQKMVEINPGVDFPLYQQCKAAKNIIRAKWGLPSDKKMIISVGRNHPKKGFIDLLKALAILNAGKDRFIVVIVGKNTDSLLIMAKELGVQENYYPIDELTNNKGKIGSFPSPELIELYHASDYFVLPSYIETYANVAVEAMAAGVPAIVTDTPGCIDTLTDYKEGLIVSAYAPGQIAEKILLLENDRSLHDNLIQNGLKKAQGQDWDIVTSQYLAVYKRLLSSHNT